MVKVFQSQERRREDIPLIDETEEEEEEVESEVEVHSPLPPLAEPESLLSNDETISSASEPVSVIDNESDLAENNEDAKSFVEKILSITNHGKQK